MESYNLSAKECEILNEIESMKQLNVKSKIDPSKLEYNDRYKSFDFWAKKFPKGYTEIPEMRLVIEYIKEKNMNKSPLDEINERTEFDQDYIKISER
jgi:hypothetical protein